VQFWPQLHHPPGSAGPETLKAKGHIFENCLQYKRCSAGCKLTGAVLGTSASLKIIAFPKLKKICLRKTFEFSQTLNIDHILKVYSL